MYWDKFLSSGTYGYVHLLKDESGNPSQVVKVSFTERQMDFIGAWREIDMLTRLQHPFIVSLTDVQYSLPTKIPKNKDHQPDLRTCRQENIFMFFEVGDYDLESEIIEDVEDVKLCMVHAMLALEYMHSHHHLHRDIKPGNLLYFEDEKICKLIDMGMCLPTFPGFKPDENDSNATTNSFRAPELFLQEKSHTSALDVWSLGLTWVYCLLQKQLDFEEWFSQQKHIDMIIENVPVGLSEEEAKSLAPEVSGIMSWADYLEEYDNPELRRILSSMLQWKPEKRATITQLLDDRYFDKYRELITTTRRVVTPIILQPYKIEFTQSPERKDMFKFCKPNSYITWRMVFHAMDIVDRYINHRIASGQPRPEFRVRMHRAWVCMYLAYKYFNVLTKSCSIEKVLDISPPLSQADRQEMAMWEIVLVRDILKYEIYRPTIYEMCGGSLQKIKDSYIKYIDPHEAYEMEIKI